MSNWNCNFTTTWENKQSSSINKKSNLYTYSLRYPYRLGMLYVEEVWVETKNDVRQVTTFISFAIFWLYNKLISILRIDLYNHSFGIRVSLFIETHILLLNYMFQGRNLEKSPSSHMNNTIFESQYIEFENPKLSCIILLTTEYFYINQS